MANKSPIQWTDLTSNPLRAINLETGCIGHYCERVSEACRHCYAAAWNRKQQHRRKDGQPSSCGTGLDFVRSSLERLTLFVDEDELAAPMRIKRPQKIFLCDMTDLFLDAYEDDVIARVWAWMLGAYWHTFQVLTKRAERMRDLLNSDDFRDRVGDYLDEVDEFAGEAGLFDAIERRTTDWRAMVHGVATWPARNIWVGVTAEDDHHLQVRSTCLRETPAAVRFLSLEPLLEHVNLRPCLQPAVSESRSRIGWVICGGESGRGSRPSDPEWFRFVRDQCVEMDVAFFFKQHGDWCAFCDIPDEVLGSVVLDDLPAKSFARHSVHRIGKLRAGRTLDGRTWDQFPKAGE